MKILRVDSFVFPAAPEMALMPDSAIRPDRRPLFLPAGDWECQVRVAVRIDRLGKAVSEKFAPRYYSQFALVNYLKPLGAFSWPDMMDDALVAGQWMDVQNATMPVAFGSEESSVEIDRSRFNRLFQILSAHTTFKTGDVIILPESIFSYAPRVDTHVEIRAGNTTILEFNIK